MFFPPEGLYGTVTDRKINFSRVGGIDTGSSCEFVGTLVSNGSGTKLVGDVDVKWYVRASAIVVPCLFVTTFAISAIPSNQNGIPVLVVVPMTLLMLLGSYSLIAQLRRTAEGFANYVGLVVGNAFSLSPPPFTVS
jgi:hypothetical protein